MKSFLRSLAFCLLFSPAFAANPIVEFKTSMGNIEVELFAEQAPKSVENFLVYVNKGDYDGTIFHRVIDGFMIQGGGFDTTMAQRPTRDPVENEANNGLKNLSGTLAMARTSAPHSATAQFFINLVDNNSLDYPSRDGWGYAVFGKVTKGMETIEAIAKVATGNAGMHQNVPLTPIIIESARLLEDSAHQ